MARAEEVTVYKAGDGRSFDTLEEAEIHEGIEKIRTLVREHLFVYSDRKSLRQEDVVRFIHGFDGDLSETLTIIRRARLRIREMLLPEEPE